MFLVVCRQRSRVLLLIWPTLLRRFTAAKLAPVTVLWCLNPPPPASELDAPPIAAAPAGSFKDMCFVMRFPFSSWPKADIFFALCIPSIFPHTHTEIVSRFRIWNIPKVTSKTVSVH